MTDRERELYNRALSKYGEIFLCGSKQSFEESFTREGSLLLFWFNLASGTTKVEILPDEIGSRPIESASSEEAHPSKPKPKPRRQV